MPTKVTVQRWYELFNDLRLSYVDIALQTGCKLSYVTHRAHLLRVAHLRARRVHHDITGKMRGLAIQLHLEGQKMPAIAAHLEISVEAVRSILRGHGISSTKHGRAFYAALAPRVRRLRGLGWSWGQIGAELEIAPDTLRVDRTKPSFEAVTKYAAILKQTQVANQFTLGNRRVSFRRDDFAFMITYERDGRRLQFIVNDRIISFTRAEIIDGAWKMTEGEVQDQTDTWMLLRWVSDGFAPQVIEWLTP